jgi:hypothetical protein
MAGVKEKRRRLTLVMAVLLCLDVAAAGVLFSPIGQSSRPERRREAQQQKADLLNDLRAKNGEVEPGRNIGQKLGEAKQELEDFYTNRLPGSYSSMAEHLGKLAAENSVQISSIRYRNENAEVTGLQRVQIETGVTGDYVQVVKFINALERGKLFFIIDSVSLGQTEGGVIHLQVQLGTYMKTA